MFATIDLANHNMIGMVRSYMIVIKYQQILIRSRYTYE